MTIPKFTIRYVNDNNILTEEIVELTNEQTADVELESIANLYVYLYFELKNKRMLGPLAATTFKDVVNELDKRNINKEHLVKTGDITFKPTN